jgi:hypothetical protein
MKTSFSINASMKMLSKIPSNILNKKVFNAVCLQIEKSISRLIYHYFKESKKI